MELAKLKEYAQLGEPLKGQVKEPVKAIATDELGLMYPIHYEAAVYPVDDIWTLILTVDYQYKTNCSRCLKEMVEEVSTKADYLITETSDQAQFYEDSSDEEVLVWEARDSFLDELVMSLVVTSMPMQTLCQDDCKGICPMCGQDLNTGDCNCEKSNLDPRFAALQGLFDED